MQYNQTMAWAEWIDIPVLKLISRHTFGSLAAIASYVAVSRSVEWAVGPGMVQLFIEGLDQCVLVLILLYFVVTLGYDLFRELRRNAN